MAKVSYFRERSSVLLRTLILEYETKLRPII